jgi:hypothetical protein
MTLVNDVANNGKNRKEKMLVGKSEGKRLLERLRPAWEDNIRLDQKG